LFSFDAFEERLKVALSEALGTFAVDDFIEQGRPVGDRFCEDLEQIPFVVTVNQNSKISENINVFVNLSHSIWKHIVVGFGNAQEVHSTGAESRHGVDDIVGAKSDVLNSSATEIL
jgi:hypothetical protein